jgi:glycosyltransferase involved in cell wall biosynthesis
MLTVSVIIPSLHSPLIDRVVDSVRAQTCAALEIIVVGMDRAGLLAGRTDVCFVDTGRPISPAAARNAGAAQARGDICCFIDADCLAAPDWIEQIIARHAAGAQVVGGGVALPRAGYWTLCDNLAGLADFMEWSPAGTRAHLPSLNFSIRRALFESLGGFDQRFTRPSGEDTDLCFRLRRQGHALLFEPRARVTHCPPRTSVRHMWAHFHMFGATYLILQQQNGDLIGCSLRVVLCQRWPWLAVILAPLLALLDSITFYRRNPALARYWYALPGITLARLAWYIGLAFGADRFFLGAAGKS